MGKNGNINNKVEDESKEIQTSIIHSLSIYRMEGS
jgi:hypothetical protein